MDKGLAKTLTRQQFKGILRKVGASASDPVLDAVCGYYRLFAHTHLRKSSPMIAHLLSFSPPYNVPQPPATCLPRNLIVPFAWARGSEIVDDPLAQKSESDLVEYTRFIKDIAQLFPSM